MIYRVYPSRDEIVAAVTGTTSFDGVSYSTKAENITGLLAPGSNGVNHGHRYTHRTLNHVLTPNL